jgi:hypothetical protein
MLSALTIIGCLLVVGLFLDAFLLKGRFVGELLIGAAVHLLLNAVFGGLHDIFVTETRR